MSLSPTPTVYGFLLGFLEEHSGISVPLGVLRIVCVSLGVVLQSAKFLAS